MPSNGRLWSYRDLSVVTVNDMRDGGFRIGSVGKALPDTEVKIAEMEKY